jgi:hypothetical protein
MVMKKIACLVGLAALAAATVRADSDWGVGLSYWNPADGKGSAGPLAKISIEMIPSLQLEIRAAYHDNLLGDGSPDKLNVVPLEAGLTLKAPVGGRVNFYGGAGPGFYFFDGAGHSTDKIGFYGVAGVELTIAENKAFYGATHTCLFAEVMYRDVKGDVLDDGRSLNLAGPVGTVGLSLHW